MDTKERLMNVLVFVICALLCFILGIYFDKFQANPKLNIYSIDEVNGLDAFLTSNDWETLNVSCISHSMSNVFDCENTVLFQRTGSVRPGDIIVFHDGTTNDSSTIHQYLNKIGDCHITKGVNNFFPDTWCTTNDKIIGRAVGVLYTSQNAQVE